MTKKILETLSGKSNTVPPIWLMRQAGRYLPEYLETRKEAGDFWGLVYNPALATEVTLQPIRRYGLDAAILFSDILVIPQALGQHVSFAPNHGPVLGPLPTFSDFKTIEDFHQALEPVYEAVQSIRKGLDTEGFGNTTLIGFSGAPWTLACYMVEGSGSKDFLKTRRLALGKPDFFQNLIDILTDRVTAYLCHQVKNGAEVIQLFDTWAGVLPPSEFTRWVIEPTRRIVDGVRKKYPQIPVIAFPKGAGWLLPQYVASVKPTAISLDAQTPLDIITRELPRECVLQGNLDPALLIAGGKALQKGVEDILTCMVGRPFIFNLGHGIDKETPPAHVAELMVAVRQNP
jgi:uroporphyrinogen decarboxylase